MSLSKPSNRSSTPRLFLIAFLCGCALWSIDTLAQQPGSKLWEFGAGGSGIPQPAIDEYGNLFFGSGSSGRFYALDSTGSELWEYQTGGQVVAPASLGPDGTVYFSSTDQKLYAFTPTGRRKWTFAPGGYPSGAPAVGVDGTIYVGFGSTLYSLNPDSAVNWQFSVSSTLGAGGAAIGADGTIYFGSWDQHVYALSPAGTNKWNYSDNFPANGPPALDTNGNVYVGFDSGSIQVLNPQGTRIWGYSTLRSLYSSAIIGADGTVYLGSEQLYALTAAGAFKWKFGPSVTGVGTVAVAADGTIYAGSDKLYALNPTGLQKWSFAGGQAGFGAPTIGADGTVYVGCEDGKLYAVKGLSALASSAWPNYRRNARHTARSSHNTPPSVYITSPTNTARINSGGNIAIEARALSDDGTVARVEFFQGNTSIGVVTNRPFVLTWANVVSGNHVLKATATDNLGQQTTSGPVAIIVDTLPLVTLTSPTNGATVSAGSTITLAATASDSDGSVLRVDFFVGATLVGSVTNGPYQLSWTVPGPGDYLVLAEATDNLGGQRTVDNFAAIHAVLAPSQALLEVTTEGLGTVKKSPDSLIYTSGTSVTLTAMPGTNYVFQTWSDGITTNPRIISIGTTNEYTAIFTPTGTLEHVALRQGDHTYGRGSTDHVRSVLRVYGNTHVIGGSSFSGVAGNNVPFGFGEYDYLLLKEDANGNQVWNQSFGGNDRDDLQVVLPTSNGGYLLAGSSKSPVSGNKTTPNYGQNDYWVVKVDDSGVKQWEKDFGGNGDDVLNSVVATRDGGYLLCGTSDGSIAGNKTSPAFGSRDFWIVRIDAQGNKLWEKSYGGDNIDLLSSAQETTDGGFILGGTSYSGATGNKTTAAYGAGDYWIIKTDANGVKQWEKTHGGDGWDNLVTVQQTADSGYIVGGSSQSGVFGTKTAPYYGDFDYWIVKLDSLGARQWDKSFGGNSADQLRALVQTTGGGYLLAGESSSGTSGVKTTPNFGGVAWWLVDVDSAGAKQWDGGIGAGQDSSVVQALQTPDGGFLVGGSTKSGVSGTKISPNYGGQDYFVAKFAPNGAKVWEQTIGGNQDDTLTLLQSDGAGGYILAGDSASDVSGTKNSAAIGGGDFWLLDLAVFDQPAGTPVIQVNGVFATGGVILSDTPAQVAITTSFPGGNINYTLDGSTPGKASSSYTQPFIVSNSATLRAVAYNSASSHSAEAEPVQLQITTSFALDTGTAGNGTITVDPTPGPYLPGTVVTLTATPRPGSVFIGWDGDSSSTRNPLQVVMLGNRDLVAKFQKIWTLQVNEGTGGFVTRSPDLPYYLDGAFVTLTESNVDGFVFLGWSGDASGANPIFTLVMNSNRNVSANFASMRLTVDIVGNGSVARSPDRLAYALGDLVDLTATPGAYYAFSGWNDSVIGNPRTVMIGTSNHYAAIFTNTVALAPRRLKEWELDVGGTAINSFSRVLPTGDGGYLLVGTSDSGVSGNKQSAGFGNADYWIVKADASGNRQWEKALGGSQQDQVTDAINTADGGYLIAGDSYSATDGNKTSPGFGNADYWVVKLDPTGTKQWEQTFGGSGEDHLSSVSQTSDGGYILGGYSNSGRSGNKTTDSFGSHDYWLIKVDHDGVRQWEQVYGGSQSDELYRVLTTIDGGYLLGGYSYSGIDGNKKAQNRGGSDIWVVKTDGQGRMQWQQTYGGDSDESLGDLATSSDGGYFVGASSKSGISGNKTTPRYGYPDIWVFKTDGNGVQQWDQSYGNSGASSLNRLQLTADGGLLVGGSSDGPADGTKTIGTFGIEDYWVIRVDALGHVRWQQVFGGDQRDVLSDITETADGGVILGGFSSSSATGNKATIRYGAADGWVIKLSNEEVPLGTPWILANGQYLPDGQLASFNSVTVEMHSDLANASLFYTLDGTTPGATSTHYIGPFSVTSNVVIRAVTTSPSLSLPLYSEPVTVTIVANPPQVVSAAALASTKTIGIRFDQPVGAGAANPANYTLSGTAVVTNVVLRADAQSVILQYSGALDTTFTLTVRNVGDAAGHGITTVSTTIGPVQYLNATDIGNPVVRGTSFSWALGELDVSAGGVGVGGLADSIHFTYEQRDGDFDEAVQVVSLDPATSNPIAGLMVRESLLPGSREVSVLATESNTSVNWVTVMRAVSNGTSAPWPGALNASSGTLPNVWVRLQRLGNTFTALWGTNGFAWTRFAQFSPATSFSNSVWVGLATAAGANVSGNSVVAHYRHLKDIPLPVPSTVDDNWDNRFGYPNISSDVFALSVLGNGDLYVGGAFVASGPNGGLNANRIARWDGLAWSTLGPELGNGTDGNVRALAASGDAIYVAGDFNAVLLGPTNGYTVNNISKWDGVQWSRLGSDLNYGVSGQVYALAASGEVLYAGGKFTSAGGVGAFNIAKWDGFQWSALGNGLGNGQTSQVNAIAVADDGTVYAGGSFTNSGNTVIRHVARWDGVNWQPLGIGINDVVNALAVNGNILYAGGQFAYAGGFTANRLAKWDGANWSALTGGVTVGNVYALRFDGQDLYVGGSFYEVNGLPAFGIAKWDGGTWTTLGAGVTTHPINPINPPAVYAIQVNAGSVFVAGNFDTAGAVSANGLARWDGQQWKALNDSLGHPNDPAISAIAVRGNNVYAGGSFTTVAGQPANRIAKWNGSEWSLLGNNASNGVNDSVLAVAIAPDGHVYAGGTFTTASGLTANRIARWDGTKWNALRNGIENGTNPQTLAVRTLAVDTQGDVYVGGEFTQVDGLAANYIARWSGTNWSTLGIGLNGTVLATALSGGNLYVGGVFDHAGGAPANAIARWDGSAWHSLGSGVAYPGFQTSVRAIGIHGSDVIAGGAFLQAGVAAATNLARWDGQNWFPFGGGCNGFPTTILAFSDQVFVGGNFTQIGGFNVTALAEWDGTNWMSLGSGFKGPQPAVSQLAANGTDLYVVGSFTEAGNKPSGNFARWTLNNKRPEVSILQPGPNTTVPFGSGVVLGAQAGDGDGSIQEVDFYVNGARLGTVTNTPYSLIWSNLFTGDYVITAIATDNLGATGNSSPVTLHVLAPTNDIPPTVSIVAPTNGTSLASGGSLVVTAAASDSDGQITRVEVYQNSVLVGSVDNAPYNFVISNLLFGNYAFTARAIDNLGASTLSAPVGVSVFRADTPPVVNFVSPQEGALFRLPTNIVISIATSDADGQVVQLEIYSDDTLLAFLSGSPQSSFNWTNATPGVHKLTIRATDDAGVTTAASVNIIVNGADQQSPAQPVLSDSPKKNFWVTDGTVRAILETNGIVYLGGEFTHVGSYVQGAVLVDLTATPPDFDFPIVSGLVNVILGDGSSGFYLGGLFSSVGGIARTNLVHIRYDKTVDPDWAPATDGAVRALVSLGSSVYLAGDFGTVNGQARAGLAAVGVVNGGVTAWNPAPNGSVSTLTASANIVYAAGSFSNIGAQPRNYIAALDPLTGAATAWQPISDDLVSAITFANGQLYVAGSFRNIGGQVRIHLAGLDPATGLATTWNPGCNYAITQMVAASNNVYAIGGFDFIGGAVRYYLAALDAIDGHATAWDAKPNNTVSAITVAGDTLYAVGQFDNIGLQYRNHFGAVSLTTGAATPLDLTTSGNIASFGVSAGRVLAAGSGQLQQVARNHAAALDAATGAALSWDPNCNATVWSMVVTSNKVYLGGDFTLVGNQNHIGLAAVDPDFGAVSTWNPAAGGSVRALVVVSNEVYVGGFIQELNGQPCYSLGAIDATTGARSAWNPVANDGVQTFLAFESTLYLGGNFTSVNGQTRNHLAALDLATGQLSSWNPNANGNVVAMTGNGGTVYVSGGFDHIGGRTRQWLAALSLDTGLADLWTPGPDGAPLSLAFAQNTVFAGGQFNYIGGKTRLNLAGLDARLDYNNALTWNPVSRGLVVDDSVIYTVRASSTTVYISGKARFGEDQRPYLAAYDLPPTLATPKLISKQSLQLNMAGARGKYYILQSSTNLVNWTPILTNFGPFTLLQDSSVSTNSRRFYRVVATQ